MPASLEPLLGHVWPLVGVVHLAPLPGSPRAVLSFPQVEEAALADAEALLLAGFDALLVENFGDHPFFPEAVEPHTVAAMALVVAQVRRLGERLSRPRPVGVNVLRNDARSAIGIAGSSGARFVRVNVHVGAMVTDQGLLVGRAYETLRYRRAIGSEGVAVLADVLVKHAVPLGAADIVASARDAFHRGGAEALIVSGSGTGEPADLARARRIRSGVPGAPVLIGSGVTASSLGTTMASADGAIVGTWVKRRGLVNERVDPGRARELVEARDAALGRRTPRGPRRSERQGEKPQASRPARRAK